MFYSLLYKISPLFTKIKQPIGKVKTVVPFRPGKSALKQLRQLKKQLSQKQPIKNESLYQEYHHRQVYKKIDTDIQAFFHKREYTLQNFNFLINLLGHQMKFESIFNVLKKMEIMRILPDARSYNYIVRAASSTNQMEAAEKYLKIASQNFGDNKYIYTSLMQGYVWSNNPEMALKIVQQMKEKGIQPDLPTYTTLINAFRVGRKLQKCWKINKEVTKQNLQLDQTYVGVMMKVHAATHDAEKAIKLYNQEIVLKNIKPMIQTTNCYFKALSNRVQYATNVIDKFMEMVQQGKIINEQTVRWALRACGKIGNLKSAIQIVKVMKLKGIEANSHIYNNLITVYAAACSNPQISQEYRQMILTDTWKLLEEAISKNIQNVHILNSALLVYANSLEDDKIEGLILPLYQKFNIQMIPQTYEILMSVSYRNKDFNTSIKLWNILKDKVQQKRQAVVQAKGKYEGEIIMKEVDMRPTFNMLQNYIQIGIRMMNMPMILQALQVFKKINRLPKNSTLKFLGNLPNLPEQIKTSLMDFKIQFGAARMAKSKSSKQKSISDPQSL